MTMRELMSGLLVIEKSNQDEKIDPVSEATKAL